MCCAGTPIIIGALSAIGLSFLRNDAILWPVMLGSLAVALWGFWRGALRHHQLSPMVLGVLGAASLALGVIVVHGFPAMQMIYGGAVSTGGRWTTDVWAPLEGFMANVALRYRW